MNSCPTRKSRKEPEQKKGKINKRKPEIQTGSTYAGVVAESTCVENEDEASGDPVGTGGPAGTGGPVGIGGPTVSETIEILEEEIPEDAGSPTVAENDERNHPVYKFISHLASEVNKQRELRENREKEEAAKVKSPPRKKKNCSLYRK